MDHALVPAPCKYALNMSSCPRPTRKQPYGPTISLPLAGSAPRSACGAICPQCRKSSSGAAPPPAVTRNGARCKSRGIGCRSLVQERAGGQGALLICRSIGLRFLHVIPAAAKNLPAGGLPGARAAGPQMRSTAREQREAEGQKVRAGGIAPVFSKWAMLARQAAACPKHTPAVIGHRPAVATAAQ